MRWLHLSDLHIGKDNQSQEVAISLLVDAVNKHSSDRPYDLVLLTGDLAFSGKPEEYDQLAKLVLLPLRNSPLFKNSQFLSIPGNHDVDCDSGLPIDWKTLGSSRQEKFFHCDASGQSLRAQRAQVFRAYSDFIKNNGLGGVDPTMEPARLDEITCGEENIYFLTMVTAFFSDKQVSDKHRTPVPLHALRYLLKDRDNSKPLFILGHHPREWFTRETKDHFRTLLVNENVVYLHGHNHRVGVDHGPMGIINLGFGAGYITPADWPPTPYYRNSFAICEYDESLHISVISWEAEQGQWKPDNTLPVDFNLDSDKLDSGYILTLPTTRLSDNTARNLGAEKNLLLVRHKAEHCLWLAKDERKAWAKLLNLLGHLTQVGQSFSAAPSGMPPGHVEFRLRDDDGVHLVRAISAPGDLIHFDLIETVNTQLDTDTFESCIIVTLGEVARDAQELATRLADKKPIKVIDGIQVAEDLLQHLQPSLKYAINQFDPRETSITLLILDDGANLLVRDQLHGKWFKVYGSSGDLLPESSGVVTELRELQPILNTTYYSDEGFEGAASDPEIEASFSRDDYLEKCYSHFNDAKYAPLAALGFRFSNASLNELYVPANADYNPDSKSSESLDRAVSEFLDSINIESAQKDQLERQLRSTHGLNRSSEVGAAQQLYRKYGNIIVLGDPGSGKTCFVKHEILTYCRPKDKDESWYTKHLPIYVPLSEAARLLDNHEDLLAIASIVVTRYTQGLPLSTLHNLLGEGHLALFFDGLDEVGNIEDRIKLLTLINRLITKYGRLGNRFVMTSRPAAIQPVDIPSGFTHIQLKGLSETEMRILAGRVVSSRLRDSNEGELHTEEKELIDRLMEDCQNTSGIRRIARNPLLLTLLVLVYANSGALFAKRHVVYYQAVKTLVSVRNRLKKSQVLSESDLRKRLGVLALAIYQRAIGEIPNRKEVQHVLAPYVEAHDGETLETADSFIQEVAEATGLLVIHQRDLNREDDVISFMHYSFLEYYAAVGFLQRDFEKEAPLLVNNSRWNDILTLMFGILSEQQDITDFLAQILQEKSIPDRITKKRLLFGMDCALECDVPPERSQQLIMVMVEETISNGPAKISLELRIELAKRLSQLLVSTGSPYIISRLVQGMLHKDPCICAAFIDLFSHLDPDIKVVNEGLEAFEAAFNRSEPVIRCACAEAMQARPEFRTDLAIVQVKKGLGRGFLEKHACLRTIELVQGLMGSLWHEVVELLDDSNAIISGAAARCILASGFFESPEMGERQILEKALGVWQHGTQPRLKSNTLVSVNKDHISTLVESNDVDSQELGIRYLSLLEKQGLFVYKTIFSTLKNTKNHRIISASLQALRQSTEALGLITLADADHICSLLEHKEKDVRIETIRVLEALPGDEQVISALWNHLNECTAGNKFTSQESEETLRALASHADGEEELEVALMDRILTAFCFSTGKGFGNKKEQQALRQYVKICEDLGGTVKTQHSQSLVKTANDFRAPNELRRQSLKTYGKLVEPTKESVRELTSILKSKDHVLRHARYDACLSFVKKCRGKIDYVRAIYKELPSLNTELCTLWDTEYKQVIDRIDHRTLGNLRKCVMELEELLVSYDEYSQRMQLVAPTDQTEFPLQQN